MFVSAAAECFTGVIKEDILPQMVDLEFTSVELPLHETGFTWGKPSEVLANFDHAVEVCRDISRLSICAFSVDPGPWGGDYYKRFAACCKLAKSLRMVPMVVPAAELGTPFNEEIERLRELVRIAALEGCLVALRTQIGCMTEDPDTAVVLCNNVKGLGLALDPSHYITGPRQGRDFSKVIPYVFHVHLRDSTKSQMHVRIGQGEIDYGRLITQLQQVGYDRALSVNMLPIEGCDHRAEMRKMRLLLDSLL